MSWKKAVVTRFHSNMVTAMDIDSGERFECMLRGKFKQQKIRPIVGDYIEYSSDNDNLKVENILPQKNRLYRPNIANVDQVVLVTTLKDPEVDLLIVDKFLIQAEKEKLDVLIIVNKVDLLNTDEEKFKLEKFINTYSEMYDVITTSKFSMENINLIKDNLKNKISTMAGMSGVGKSSLLNIINKDLSLKTGEISDKLKRGKHTTTFTELLYLDFGGFIADTPGFANLELLGFDTNSLKNFFPEFDVLSAYCAFSNCAHINEPDCEIKRCVDSGEISKSRYNNYLHIYSEISKRRDKKW